MSGPGGTVNARRELTAAVLGAAVAGGLALSAGGQSWAAVSHERGAPLPPVHGVLTGADAAPLVPAAGLVLLASAVALFAVRGVARMAMGLLMAIAGGVLMWSGVRALTGGLTAASIEMPGVGQGPGQTTVDVSAAWPTLAIVAGLLGVAAGLLTVLRGRHWPAMGRRYERVPATPPRHGEDRAQEAWKALDRGDDPTADPTVPPSEAPGDRPV